MTLTRRTMLIRASQAAAVSAFLPAATRVSALSQSEPQQGGTLSIATTVDADSMDPHQSTGLASRARQSGVFDRLVYRDSDGTFKPWLAESWEVSDDELEITFKLVEDRQFTDNTPVNAEAVKYTFDRLMDPERASSAATQFPAMSVEVVDEFSVRFTLEEPFAPFFSSLTNPAGGIISPTAAEATGPDFGQQPVGSGPFMLESWTKDTEMVLVRNPNYSSIRADRTNQGPAHIEKLIYQIIVEDSTRVNAVRTGDVQVASGSYTLAGTLANDSEVDLVVADVGAANINYLEFNMRKPPFDDLLVRQAVGYAVDAQEIVDVVYFGYAALNQTMLPTGVAGYNEAVGQEFGFTFDPDRARELLDEAGWVLPDGESVRQKDGESLTVELLSWTSNNVDRVTQLIQAQLGDVGIEVTINLMEAGAFLAAGSEGQQNFDFMRTTWDEPVILTRALGGGGTFENFQDEEFDALLEDAASVMNWEERQQLLDQANQMILEEAFAVPLLTDYEVYLVRSEVQGFGWDASGWEKLVDISLS